MASGSEKSGKGSKLKSSTAAKQRRKKASYGNASINFGGVPF